MKQTKREQIRLQRQQETRWIALIIMAIVIVVGVVVTLVALDENDIDVHTDKTKVINIVYPTETVYTNITNVQTIEKTSDVNLDYLQDCTQLSKPNGEKYIYCR